MLTDYTKQFIERLPLTRPGRDDKASNDPHAQENATKVEKRFGIPQPLWFEITDEFRKYFSNPKEEAAFLAGIAVGWHESAKE